MEEGDCRCRLISGDIMACAILPVPRKDILLNMFSSLLDVEKYLVMVPLD